MGLGYLQVLYVQLVVQCVGCGDVVCGVVCFYWCVCVVLVGLMFGWFDVGIDYVWVGLGMYYVEWLIRKVSCVNMFEFGFGLVGDGVVVFDLCGVILVDKFW